MDAGWRYEGIAWKAPTEGIPVYRLYSKMTGDHHYTIDSNERDHLVRVGWIDEGVGWYSAGEDGVPVYRVFNPKARGAGSHHYTVNVHERDSLVAAGWRNENIGWYGI